MSVILFIFIRVEEPVARIAIRLLLIPVIASLSYEIIRLAGRYDNVFIRIITAPGLWIQRLTTKEPADDMIEVAIVALKSALPDEFPEETVFEGIEQPTPGSAEPTDEDEGTDAARPGTGGGAVPLPGQLPHRRAGDYF